MITAALEAAPAALSRRSLLAALGQARASFYRRRRRREVPEAKPASRRCPRRLTASERARVLEVLHEERFVDSSPAEVCAQLLDEGTYLCSERTMYRLLGEQKEVRERRRQRVHPPYHRPELLANGVKQLWSWDITKLKGPGKGVFFSLYVILDVFSRYVVGYMVAERESAFLAEKLISETVWRQEVERGKLTLHADRGAAMTSKGVSQLLSDLAVTRSHSRPHTSDDNPFSESQFKTLKYHPEFPERFMNLEDAQAFCRRFFHWYNHAHHHSALAYLTPADVHHGQAEARLAARKVTLKRAFEAHPERFPAGQPRTGTLPEAVYINPPSPIATTDSNTNTTSPVEVSIAP